MAKANGGKRGIGQGMAIGADLSRRSFLHASAGATAALLGAARLALPGGAFAQGAARR